MPGTLKAQNGKGGIIGQLRQRFSIQSTTRTSDGQGGYTDSWAAISDQPIWGKIEPFLGKEIGFGGKIQHRITHLVTIRYLSTVTPDMRILYGSRVLHIHGISSYDELDQFQELRCEEGAPS